MSRLSVSCPRCQTTYQVDPELKGRRMRCPNVLCQEIFEVADDSPAGARSLRAEETRQVKNVPPEPPNAKESGQQVGNVGDIVPILPADIAPPNIETPAKKSNSPPPKRPRSKPTAEENPFQDLHFNAADAEEVRPGQQVTQQDWTAPPVRGARFHRAEESGARFHRAEESGARFPRAEQPGHAKNVPHESNRLRQRIRWLIAVLALLLVTGAAATAWLVFNRRADIEAELFTRAETWFENGEFTEAAAGFQRLLLDYPASTKRAVYQFHAELSSVLAAVHAPATDTAETVRTLDRFGQFVRFQQGGPLFSRHQDELTRAARTLAQQLLEHAEQKNDHELLTLADNAWQTAVKLRDPAHIDSPRDKELTQRLATLSKRFAAREHRKHILDQLRQLPTAAKSVLAARKLVAKEKLDQDPEASALVDDLITQHRESIVYSPSAKTPETTAHSDEPSPTIAYVSAVTVPAALQANNANKSAANQLVLALARGVLYGIDAQSGQVRWLKRVGVDALHLPLRIAATPISEEMAILIGGEQHDVYAIDFATGADVWLHRLDSACVTQPLLAHHRLFVPTVSGQIEELDCFTGRRHGSFKLGQRLALPPTIIPGTPLIHCAADESCLYVLDTAKRTCVAILYNGHASGSLRTPPLIARTSTIPQSGNRDYLFLLQADGAASARLRTFALPFADPLQRPVQPDIKVNGVCSFPPWHDGETLALVTDTGTFAAYGIRQPRNADPALFPIFEQHVSTAQQPPRRAQLVHADAENYWVLADGALQRMQRRFSTKTGPALIERWPQPLQLGDPLHEPQVLMDDATTTLFLTTQPRHSAHVLLTAVDAVTGHIFWQQRLGIVVDIDPVLIDKYVLLREQDRGSLHTLHPPGAAPLVIEDGKNAVVLPSSSQTHLLAASTGTPLLARSAKNRLTLHRFDKGRLTEATNILLSAPLSGPPALIPDFLIAPLASGLLERAALVGEQRTLGPSWRNSNADSESPAHLIAVGDGDFIVSDGDRGLRLIHWPDAKSWQIKAQTQLPTAVVTLALLPREAGSARIVAAESSGVVSVLDPATLHVRRTWQMPGRITSGPFVRGQELACIIDGNRLVWLDIEKDRPAWEYTFDADIVGQPHVHDGLVIVGTTAGQIQALDRKSVTLRGAGYVLRDSVAPTAAPLPVSEGRLYVALTDGTAIILPISVVTAE